MGQMFWRALETAGLAELGARTLQGAELTSDDLARLRTVDVLLVAGLADAKRAQLHGDDVRVLRRAEPSATQRVFDRAPTERGATGAELLLEVALLRLGSSADVSIAVDVDAVGIELAQTALVFGADTLIADLGSGRSLPLLSGAGARQQELAGLIARSGRRPQFADGRLELEIELGNEVESAQVPAGGAA